MKQRIISAAAGLCVLGVVIFFFDTVFFNIVVTVVTVIAVYEVLLATKYVDNKLLAALCLLFAAFVPSLRYTLHSVVAPSICLGFAAALFLMLLAEHQTMRIEQIGLAFFISLVIPLGFSVIIIFRDNYGSEIGLFYILLSLAAAWINDSGAYFVGRAFGKHKLAPEISPKKTVEGAIGGVISTLIFCTAFSAFYTNTAQMRYGHEITLNYVNLIIFLILAAGAGILGDLAASIIKRQCSVKDFGNILPGHGGVLDRFDSWLFVGPLLYVFTMVFPIIT